MKFAQVAGALASILSICSPVLAQLPNNAYNPSQFINIGTITAMTLNTSPRTGEDPLLRGGTITVDGLKMIIPDNTMATLPAANVAWPELFSSTGVPQINVPSVWKATVFGNRITNAATGVDELIIGLIYLSQDSLRTISGFVTSINQATGHFTIEGAFAGQAGAVAGTGGIDCVLNDPTGVYYNGAPTALYTSNPLWSVDPANPSVHSSTGYPMCIPSSATDVNCPAKNRPTTGGRAGVPLQSFTFPSPAQVAANPTLPDPMFKAPVLVGDYVIIVGQWAGPNQPSTPPATAPVFEVNGMTVNLELLTARGIKPAYVTVESALFGITVPISPDQPETRAVAFVTDPSQSLEWLAQDINPCTGAITERSIMVIAPQDPVTGGAAPAGRAIFRLGKTIVTPPPKNSVFRLSGGTLQTNGKGAPATLAKAAVPAVPAKPGVPAVPAQPAVAAAPADPTVGGILAGQFINPTFGFTFPEVIPFGAPQVQLEFDVFDFLLKGAGPYVPGNVLTAAITGTTGPPIVKRLNPFPAVLPIAAPAVIVCPPGTAKAPIAQPPAQAPPIPAPAPAPTTPTPVDTVTIISVTVTRSKGGFDIINAVAKSSNPKAILTTNLVASIAIPDSNMSCNAAGTSCTAALQEKGVSTRLNIISNLGGKACFNFDGSVCIP